MTPRTPPAGAPARRRRRGAPSVAETPPAPSGIIAILGRPNVGKSTLFNRLTGRAQAIVAPEAGLTRDRLYGTAEWRGRLVTLTDTAGLDPVLPREQPDDLAVNTQAQTQVALAEADVLCFVCDVRAGVTADDLRIAEAVRRSGRPVVLVANKSDSPTEPHFLHEMVRLGLGPALPVSGLRGMGTGDLLDALLTALPPPPAVAAAGSADGAMRCAIVGRPNVGKSSLLNAILGSPRALVSSVPGTTRDPIDTWVDTEEGRVRLIDTAGIRRRGVVTADVERFSLLRALRAVERADVGVLVVDAEAGLLLQDRHIAGYARDAGASLLVVLNKWDRLDTDTRKDPSWTRRLRESFDWAPGTPFLFVSALRGRNVEAVLPAAWRLAAARAARVPTPQLNAMLTELTATRPPPHVKSRRIKLYYATQTRSPVPTFALFVNEPQLMHFAYRRFIENQIRARWGFEGAPIRILLRSHRLPGRED